jgi:RNA polymerase sigma factor (sigma-70 family)
MTGLRTNVVLQHIRELAAADGTDRQLLERFAAAHEEAAFAALVRRHGPLVMGVCRRVLHNPHDAEDAFQATFLALARQADTAGRQASLGTWLYQVAYRTAPKARQRSAVRWRHEKQVPPRSPGDPLAEVTGRELLTVLDQELHRLPERLRAPLVLCYLQSKTRDEAARELGWSLSTLKRRLEQGRTLLHARVTGRGIALAALLAAGVGGVAVSSALAATTTSAARLVASGNEAAVVAPVLDLMRSSLQAATAGTRKAIAAVLLAVTLLAAGAGWFAWREPAPPADEPLRAGEAPKPAPEKRPAEAVAADKNEWTISGRILADGKPVAEAEVAVVSLGGVFAANDYQVLKKATTDREGRFRLTVPRQSRGETFLLAGKSGHAFGQQILKPAMRHQETTLALPAEQRFHGRLLDLQGQPAAGVKVAVTRIGDRDDLSLFGPPDEVPLWPKPATSDADGRFSIAGLPRDQEVLLQVPGDERFAWQHLPLAANNGDKERTWTLSPARLLQGTVVGEDTGKPLAKARVNLGPAAINVRTDADGRFKVSLPAVDASRELPLRIYPAKGDPYLPVRQEITWPRGAIKHTVEVKVPRGVLVRGKVMEAGSDRPVAGAGIQFLPRETDNPNLRPAVLTGYQHVAASDSTGCFEIVVLLGPGHLLVSGPGMDFIHEEIGSNVLATGKPGGARVYPDGYVKLDLAPKSEPKEVAITLRRGVTVEGRLLDPAGKPVAHARMVCRLLLSAVPALSNVDVRDGVFALHGCDPEKEYPVMFLDSEHGWGANVVLAGNQAAGDPVTVRLSPCGRATARLVDADGKPLAGYLLRRVLLHVVITPGPTYEEALGKGVLVADDDFAENLVSHKERADTRNLKTDAEGRFTYAGLIPGATYRLSVLGPKGVELKKEFEVRAEKTLDLGDIAIK